MADKRKDGQSSGEGKTLLPADKKKKTNSNDSEEDKVFTADNMADDVRSKLQSMAQSMQSMEQGILQKLEKLKGLEHLLNKAVHKLDAMEA